MMQSIDRKIAIAPMMDWTDRHYRYFMRQITRRTLFYTEMVSTGALLHQDPARWLSYHPVEQPLALQLGGADPDALATCATMAEDWGYQEVNLNVGCPSSRVQAARFGACLMAEPGLVAECLAAMQAKVKIPVTIKTRIGIDEQENYQYLRQFVEQVAQSGCRTFIIHARKAWLQGLSPKQNREIPPLRYDWVWQLKRDLPQLTICINGGIQSLAEMAEHLQHVDGVMLGRAAYQNPYLLSKVDQQFYGSQEAVKSPVEIIQAYLPYVAQELAESTPLKAMTRHILGLFHTMPGARAWRRTLSCNDQKDNICVLEQALDTVSQQNC